MRRGFGLPFAIAILVLMGTLGVYALKMSSSSVKVVADTDVSSQLKLYLYSAAELNLLWLSGDRNRSQSMGDDGKLTIFFEDGNYTFTIYNTPIKSPIFESNGTVIVDIIGESNITGEMLRVTKRFVEKP